MNQVLDYLYIGSHRDLGKPEVLKRSGVAAILKLYPDREDLYLMPKGFVSYDYGMVDGPGWSTEDFDTFNEIIRWHVSRGQKILVACAAGKSRSAIVVLSYLFKHTEMNLPESLVYLKKCRGEVDPSMYLLCALMDYHKIHPYLGSLDARWR